MSIRPNAFVPKPGVYAYLGPAGTNSEEALSLLGIPAENRKSYTTFKEVVEAVDRKDCLSGVIPIENSSMGSVAEALGALISASDVQIQAELVLDIHHALIVSERMSLSDVTEVASHPQALGQCESWISSNLKGSVRISVSSTAKAVRQASSVHNHNLAAIGSALAAEKYKGKVLFPSIADLNGNQTRFVVIGKGVHKKTNHDKTAILVIPNEDREGILHMITGVFLYQGINLTKVESLQVKGKLGCYFFYFDLLGHQNDKKVIKAIETLRVDFQVEVLGSYPSVSY